MRRLLIFTTFLGLSAGLSFADMLNGKLIDASCLEKPNPTLATCQPSSTTNTFALVDDSQKVLKLDDNGNGKAAAALKQRPSQPNNPNSSGKRDIVVVKITGTMKGDTVAVESIEVQ